jgi:chorismate synthase
MKYAHRDLRNILERSSARETAARVAVGAAARRLLDEFGISVMSWVTEIGGVQLEPGRAAGDPERLARLAARSEVSCPDKPTGERMMQRIDEAKAAGDSLGGIFTITVTGVPPGLGSFVQWDRKLDGRLAGALMSVQATKGVEVGVGFKAGTLPGSEVHDEIFYRNHKQALAGGKRGKKLWWPQSPRFYRKTNNAGGIEGGMSNGEPIVVRAVMKPIPTLYKPLRSVDIDTKKRFTASVERSDVCAVPAAAVVAEATVAYEIAGVFLEKFGGDTTGEIARNYRGYLKEIAGY